MSKVPFASCKPSSAQEWPDSYGPMSVLSCIWKATPTCRPSPRCSFLFCGSSTGHVRVPGQTLRSMSVSKGARPRHNLWPVPISQVPELIRVPAHIFLQSRLSEAHSCFLALSHPLMSRCKRVTHAGIEQHVMKQTPFQYVQPPTAGLKLNPSDVLMRPSSFASVVVTSYEERRTEESEPPRGVFHREDALWILFAHM